ncbi:MAG TPA: hypothetical protein VEP90_15795 [Methylomirabilota bacterium]|nr:hypothetical protein [Methylomirabilota bacterium]
MNDKYFIALDKAQKALRDYKELFKDANCPEDLVEAQQDLWASYCEDALKYNNTSSPKENA